MGNEDENGEEDGHNDGMAEKYNRISIREERMEDRKAEDRKGAGRNER